MISNTSLAISIAAREARKRLMLANPEFKAAIEKCEAFMKSQECQDRLQKAKEIDEEYLRLNPDQHVYACPTQDMMRCITYRPHVRIPLSCKQNNLLQGHMIRTPWQGQRARKS